MSTPSSSASHEPRGRHAFADLANCSAFNSRKKLDLERALRDACERQGAHVLGVYAFTFEPQGETVVAVLAESHASIHTYPEHRAAFVDAFTCGDADPRLIVGEIAAFLEAEAVTIRFTERGT